MARAQILAGLGALLVARASAAAGPEAGTIPADPDPAGATSLQLQWSAPETCPTREDVEAAVARYLGDAPLPAAGSLRAEATVSEPRPGSYRLALVVETGGGTSLAQIEAAQCSLLAKAAALKIAVAVDPLAVLDRVEAEPAPAPAQVLEPEPEPELEAEPEPERTLHGSVRADGAIGYGVLPGFGAGVGLGLGLVFPRWRFEAVGSFWPPREARLAGFPETGGNLLLGAATLRGCPTPRVGRVEFPVCIGVELGAMRGRGIGLEQASVESRLWAAAQLGVAVAWRFTDHLALWVEGQAVVALVRPEFRVANAGRLHRANLAAPRGSVGLEVRF